ARFGNKFVKNVGLVLSQELGSLGALDWLLQNRLADLELAWPLFRLRFLAEITELSLKYLAAALRTFSDRLFAGDINLRRRRFRFSGCFCSLPGFGRSRLEFKPHASVLNHEER